MKKSSDEFFHIQISDLRKAINALQLCWTPLRSNFQKLFLKDAKYLINKKYSEVTLYNVIKLYTHHKVR